MTADAEIQTEMLALMKRDGITRLEALRRVHEEDPGLYKRHVREREQEAARPVAKVPRPAPSGAYGRATELAKGLMREGKAATFAAALRQVWDRDPGLYREHYAEKTAAR
jgi:hypothetical protein